MNIELRTPNEIDGPFEALIADPLRLHSRNLKVQSTIVISNPAPSGAEDVFNSLARSGARGEGQREGILSQKPPLPGPLSSGFARRRRSDQPLGFSNVLVWATIRELKRKNSASAKSGSVLY